MQTVPIMRRGTVTETTVPRTLSDVFERVTELAAARNEVLPNMHRTAMILSGGEQAVKAMVGDKAESTLDLPTANYLRDASDALAGRIGTPPELRVDIPSTGSRSDQDSSRVRASTKLARIVAHYDEANRLEIALGQLARWVPGASYAVATIWPTTIDGHPYPSVTWHYPLDTMLAQWTPLQEPADCGTIKLTPIRELARRYPHVADKLVENQVSRGGVLLDHTRRQGKGVEVVNYHDEHGLWKLVPDKGLLLDFLPNPLSSGPAFVAFTKFNYARLRGEFDDLIGMMISIARLNILAEMAVREDVFAPTNIFGGQPITGKYKKGRNQTNIFDINAKVDIPQRSTQFQAWQQIDRLERQLSIEATISPQDRGESPMSFVTGRGLNELAGRVGRQVTEYHTVFSDGLQALDSKLLEFDERSWPDITKPMQGSLRGSRYAETYRPSTHIKGRYRTRREYGAMAGVEEAVKLNGLAIMDSAGWVSKRWVRTQVSGLGDIDELEEQLRSQGAEQAVMEMILAHANNPESPEHMRAFQMAVELLPAGVTKDLAEKWLTERGEELDEQEAAMVGEMGAPEQPPDPTAVLSRLTAGGEARGGTQTIGRLQ